MLAASTGVDEFVHGLMEFLVDLSHENPNHPMLAALSEQIGQAATAPMAASAMHDLRSILQGVTAGLDYAPVLLERTGLLAQVELPGQAGLAGQVGLTGHAGHAGQASNLQASNLQASNLQGRTDNRRVELLLEALDDARTGARMAAELASETLAIQRDCMSPKDQPHTAVRLNETMRVAARLAGRLTPLELRLETDDALEVDASRSALVRVLVNLLRNAAQAIDELEDPIGAGVTISSWASDEFAFVQVADDGPGIPAATASSIFELFFTTHAEGTGIGLYVCKALVTAWGGMIHVDASAGEGARFTFSVPKASRHKSASP
jgi:signal transduction histidine kinase